ncbi:MAG: type II toxin-antitoxin system VapC family toxin [Planctomycetaceae bacterium]|nr:type II toxin-antitoxin system VapC family toxin [Planctomycetaceae bacterium]
MNRYLLDTNAAADCIFRRKGVHERVKQARLAGHRIGMGIPVLAELLAGIELSDTRERNLEILNRNIGLFRVWPLTSEAAGKYARLYAELRRRGRPMQTMDILIAAIALSLGNCIVVTTDSDLSAVPELKVENWSV